MLRCVLCACALAVTVARAAEPVMITSGPALAPNGFLVLERGSFHIERGMVRVCPDLKSITAPSGQVGCFSAINKAPLGLAKQYTPEPSLSLEEMLRNGFPKQSARLTGISYAKDRHELTVYYRIEALPQ